MTQEPKFRVGQLVHMDTEWCRLRLVVDAIVEQGSIGYAVREPEESDIFIGDRPRNPRL